MRVTRNNYSKEMMELAKVRHRKFRTKESDDVVKKGLGRGSEYDVIDIEK